MSSRQSIRIGYLLVALCSLLSAGPVSGQEEEPLLLLDDEPGLTVEVGGADNSRCYVCHLNFAAEEIAVKHAQQDIGCGDCHGDCDKHIDDESWASGGPGTPPGVMFPRENIAAACQECHPTHDASKEAMQTRTRERSLADSAAKDPVCTDCHGHHRVESSLRSAWWDKRTGRPSMQPKPQPDR